MVAIQSAPLHRALGGVERAAHLAQALAAGDGIAADAVAVQRLCQVGDGDAFRQSQAEVVIGRFVERAVVAVDRAIRLGADQAEVMAHEIQQQRLRRIRFAETGAEAEFAAVLVDLHVLRIRHAQRRLPGHERQHRRQRSRLQQVIAVQHADERAACLRQRQRQRARVAVVAAVAEQAEARIAARVLGGDLRTAVARAVVPQQAFPMDVVLGQQAVQRRRQEAGDVVDRNGDADQRGIHACVLLEAGADGPT